MKLLKDKFEKYVIGVLLSRVVAPLVAFMDGKKTLTGLVSLALWALIYAVPAVAPDLLILAQVGEMLKSALEGAGVKLDTELLVGGAGLTVVGVAHKVMKYFSKG